MFVCAFDSLTIVSSPLVWCVPVFIRSDLGYVIRPNFRELHESDGETPNECNRCE